MESSANTTCGLNCESTEMNESYRWSLEEANHLKAILYVPVSVFVALILIVGTIGNSLVLYVYIYHFKTKSTYLYIIAIAVFDLVACLFAMPAEIYDLCHPYTFYSSVGCKLFRFVESVTTFGSVIILLEIGFDRYVKICRPLRIYSIRTVRILCIAAAVLAIFLSVQTLVLFGISRNDIPGVPIQSYDCSIDEKHKKSLFSKIHYSVLTVIFVLTFTTLIVFYVKIWLEIRKRRRNSLSDQLPTTNGSANGQKKPMRTKVLPSTSTSDDEKCHSNGTLPRAKRLTLTTLSSITENVPRLKASRTTMILFCVTVAFLICYLPGVIVMICRSSIKTLETNMSGAEDVLMKLFAKLYLMNCAINPFIYSFFNVNFRVQCLKACKKLCCCVFAEKIRKTEKKTIKQLSVSTNGCL